MTLRYPNWLPTSTCRNVRGVFSQAQQGSTCAELPLPVNREKLRPRTTHPATSGANPEPSPLLGPGIILTASLGKYNILQTERRHTDQLDCLDNAAKGGTGMDFVEVGSAHIREECVSAIAHEL
ncbi:hypothetical protein BH11PSE5_BH11PSE5_24840 [soil metagenome]